MKDSEVKAYKIIKEYYMGDLKSQAYLLRHRKTGARVALLENDDDNKVFCIGFRTPVSDDTGVPHIIEHSVLCGSRKYPVKDPFVELAKGSLNTFLNAMTYPDKTVYPVASCNDKDFQNLMDVYMDAVLHPNIYSREEIFRQEGWHYELDSPDGELTRNGVVYNEMKGVFSSMDSILERQIMHSLYPDTSYRFESGGNPDQIPSLEYEDFLAFHKKYYHPSNSFIYLYGDMDMAEKLRWLDEEYLCRYDYAPVDSEIILQKPFSETREETIKYPVSDSESEEDNAVLSLNMTVGTSLDRELYQAFQIIDYALMGMQGAPLKEAILEAGIGKDVYSIYENGIYQPYYSIIAKFAKEEDKDRFLNIIEDNLRLIALRGLNKKSLEAGLNSLEFRYREADYGRYPKGLMFGLQMFDSWLYDENEPFMHIEANRTFADLREKLNTDYYDRLVVKYLIENPHRSVVTLLPEKGLSKRREIATAKELKEQKDSMTPDGIDALIKDTRALIQYQSEEDLKEDLEKIPLLSVDDIGKEPRPIKAERKDICGIEAVHHDYFTNGIGYLSLVFKNSNLPTELVPYLGLLKAVLGYMDTEDYTYAELSDEINTHTGAIVLDEVIHLKRDDDYVMTTEVNVKALYDKFPKAFELVSSILFKTVFDDYDRLRVIVREIKSGLKTQLIQSGNTAASLRSLSYHSEAHYMKEQYTGISFYQFIDDLDNRFDELKERTVAMLKLTSEHIFRPENLIISYTCDGDNYDGIRGEIERFKPLLCTKRPDDSIIDGCADAFRPERRSEGFKTSSQVQYVARSGNFLDKNIPYTGALEVVRTILNYEYLWNNLRVTGGAYGCGAGYSRSGTGVMTSFRDPHLKRTNEIFEGIPAFLRDFDVSPRDMTKFIIGTLSDMDMPLSPADAGARSFSMYMTGTSYEELKKIRLEVLSCTAGDIRECAKAAGAILEDGCLCVIGNAQKIETEKELFDEVKDLFA